VVNKNNVKAVAKYAGAAWKDWLMLPSIYRDTGVVARYRGKKASVPFGTGI
jgi:hypothetical protein